MYCMESECMKWSIAGPLHEAPSLWSRCVRPPWVDSREELLGKVPLCSISYIERLWEVYRESRRCSRDTYPESYITKYTSIRRYTGRLEGGAACKGIEYI